MVIFPTHKNLPKRWELIDGVTAINKWLETRSVSAVQSDAGRATQQVIQTLGGFWGVGRIASAGIINLLDQMSRKPLTRSAHFQEFKNKIHDAIDKDTWRIKNFETLVERKAVQLGLELKCPKCGNWSWYSIAQLDYSLTCEFCLKGFGFPITSPGYSKLSRWSYRVTGPFALPDYAKGAYSAALAIRFFAQAIGGPDRAEVTWSSGQELRLPSGGLSEADFILWYQRKGQLGPDYPTETVFGEAKSFGKQAFEDEDVSRMRGLAESFPGSVLVFATMKEAKDLGTKEIGRIRKLAEWGREYVKERDETRAPVILLTGTEWFVPHYLHIAWEEKGGKHEGLISPAWIRTRLDNLRIIADLTQQLYLDMPSYHTWRKEKWEKRAARNRADGTPGTEGN